MTKTATRSGSAALLIAFAPLLGGAIAGCPEEPSPPTDAANAIDAATVGEDAGSGEDAPGLDAPVLDAPSVGSDAGPSLPPIADPTPHVVPASVDGHDRLYGVVFAPDSSFYAVGVRARGTAASDDYESFVVHFLASGELDTGFGEAGFFARNLAVGASGELARGIALQRDGKIVVAATIEHVGAGADPRDRDVALFRLSPDGTLDTSFGEGGVATFDLSDGVEAGSAYSADSAWNVVVDAEDRLVVAVGLVRAGATDTDFGVLRLTRDGARDASFGADGLFSLDLAEASASVREVSILDDGSIAAAGYYNTAGVVRPVVYRLDASGAPISSFGTNGVWTEPVLMAQAEAYALSVHDGYFITSGYGRDDGPGDNDIISMRVSVDTGVRDLTYGEGGVAFVSGRDYADNARAHRQLPSGGILIAGAIRTSASSADAALVALDARGQLDASYGEGGVVLVDSAGGTADHFWGLAIDPTSTRAVAVGIGGTDPVTDDDGLVYLFPLPR